jgi:hypothetical protein
MRFDIGRNVVTWYITVTVAVEAGYTLTTNEDIGLAGHQNRLLWSAKQQKFCRQRDSRYDQISMTNRYAADV